MIDSDTTFKHSQPEQDHPDPDRQLIQLLGMMAERGLFSHSDSNREAAVAKPATVDAKVVGTSVVNGESRPVYKIDSSPDTSAPTEVINESGVISGEVIAASRHK